MSSYLTVSGYGARLLFEVRRLQHSVLAKFISKGQHRMLQGFFLLRAALLRFFLTGSLLQIVKEIELHHRFLLTGQTVLCNQAAYGHGKATLHPVR